MGRHTLIQLQHAGWELQRPSNSHMLRAFRRMMRDYLHPSERGQSLRERLQSVLIDPYRRENKTSRNHPRKKQETPHGLPHVVTATKTQIQQAQELRQKQKKGLTA